MSFRHLQFACPPYLDVDRERSAGFSLRGTFWAGSAEKNSMSKRLQTILLREPSSRCPRKQGRRYSLFLLSWQYAYNFVPLFDHT